MKITFAGLKTTGKVDTVWAVIDLERYQYTWSNSVKKTDFVIVWGRRGGKLQRLRINDAYYFRINNRIYIDGFDKNLSKYYLASEGYTDDIASRIFEKLRDGYHPVPAVSINDVYPTFSEDLSKIDFWEKLK